MITYRTGSWTAVVDTAGLALLSPDFTPEAVRALWAAVRTGRPLSVWLETIAGGGISALPDFALASTEGDRVRVLVRGQVVVHVDDTEIRAEGMSTWREHVGPAAAVVQMSAPEDGGQQWPLTSGVVPAAVVRTEVADEHSDEHRVADKPTVDEHRVDDENRVDDEQSDKHRVADEPLGQDTNAAEPAGVPSGAGNGAGNATDAVVLPPLSAERAQEGPGYTEADRAQRGSEAPQAQVEAGDDEPDAEAPADAEPDAEAPGDDAVTDDEDDHGGLIDSLPWDVPALRDDEPAAGSAEPDSAGPDSSDPQDPPGAQHAPGAPDPGSDPPAGPATQAPASEATVIPDGDLPLPGADPESAFSEPARAAGAPGTEDDGDHDGHTVLVAHLRSAMDESGEEAAPEVAEDTVLAGAPARPVASLVLSTGQRLELDRAALIGRAPEAARFDGARPPHLVTVPSPQQDISRTHVEVKPEGDHVVVTDLRSTNGTIVTLPGAESRRLHPGEAIPVGDGAVIDLGDGITGEIQVPGSEPQTTPPPGTAQGAEPDPAGYGRPAPYGRPDPYGEPGPYGQPAPYGRPGPYGYPPVPPGPGVPPPPPGFYGAPGAQGGAG